MLCIVVTAVQLVSQHHLQHLQNSSSLAVIRFVVSASCTDADANHCLFFLLIVSRLIFDMLHKASVATPGTAFLCSPEQLIMSAPSCNVLLRSKHLLMSEDVFEQRFQRLGSTMALI